MVWGSIAREVEAGNIDTVQRFDAGLDEGYPMYVLPVKNFLELTAWAPHQELLKSGKLRQFSEDMRGRVLFCSHQWCSYVHPDPGGDQLEALQGVIQKLAAGKMAPRGNGVVEHGFGLKMGRTAKEWVDLFQDAYIWFDFASMPQPLAAKSALTAASGNESYQAPHMGDHRAVTGDELGESATHDARETLELIEQLKRAVDSIPSYIERCAEMFILVPSVKHADRAGDVCDFNTWRQRGWCRMEFVSSRLCCANDIPVMVINSREKTPEYFNLCDTMRLFAGQGNFTVDNDKEKVAGVLEKMIEAKAVSEYEKGNIGMFRAYLTLSGTFLMGLPKSMEMPEGVSATESIKQLMKWRDDATEAKWIDETGCSPLHIACGLGRTDVVKEMVKDPSLTQFLNRKMGAINKLDAHAKTDKGMGVATLVGQCKELTPLAAAMLCGDPEMVQVLVEAGAKATIHELLVGCMMGSARNMAAFLEHAGAGFDINSKGKMSAMCNSPLHAVCMLGDGAQQPEKIQLLLSKGAAPSLFTRNMFGQMPLSCLASNPDANPECVQLLVDAGATVDGQDKPGMGFRIMRGVLATMAKTKKYANMSMMVDLVGYGRSPLHHAAHLANVGMLRALHAAGAPVEKLDSKSQSALELIQKSLPDSHAPELLSDVLVMPAKGSKLKTAGMAATAVHKLSQPRREAWSGAAKVLPNQAQTGRVLPVVPAA